MSSGGGLSLGGESSSSRLQGFRGKKKKENEVGTGALGLGSSRLPTGSPAADPVVQSAQGSHES